MRREFITLCTVLVAVLASSGIVAASSFAAPEWLLKAAKLSTEEPSVNEGKIVIHHEGGLGGTMEIECDGKFIGTVGPGAKDKITEVQSLTGEKDLIVCTQLTSNSDCPAKLTVHVIHLPWDTELLEAAGTITDDILNSGAGAPGFEQLCALAVKCEKEPKPVLVAKLPAEFEFTKANSESPCSDGGKAWATGKGAVKNPVGEGYEVP